MTWIDTVPPEEASGLLEEAYAGVAGRSGSVANIIGCQSLHPEAMRDHYGLYRTLMFSRGVLSRADREAIAVVVSAANGCHYWIEHHGAALRKVTKDEELAAAIAGGWRSAGLEPRLAAILGYAEKLTLQPGAVRRRTWGRCESTALMTAASWRWCR